MCAYMPLRPKPFQFRPPKHNCFVIWLAQTFLPIILRLGVRIARVEIELQDLQKLKYLRKERVLLLPNHGNAIEPFVLLHLSKLLKLHFAYLGAKEVFERRPIASWFLQRLGGYSIVRGTMDRASFRKTQELLKEGKHWVVIFPEGEVGWLSDEMLPFQEGIVQLAFGAASELAQSDKSVPLYLVPVAIRFVHLEDMSEEIERSLDRLERRIFAQAPPSLDSPYARLRRIGAAILEANEKKYGLRPSSEASLDERVQNLKELILSRAEATIGLPPNRGLPMLARIRDLLNRVERSAMAESGESEYSQELHHEVEQQASSLYESVSRVLRFIVIHDGYVQREPTTERFMDVLRVLELELTGKRRFWGPRKAMIRIGTPLDISKYSDAYKLHKRDVLQTITTKLENQERAHLANIRIRNRKMHPR